MSDWYEKRARLLRQQVRTEWPGVQVTLINALRDSALREREACTKMVEAEPEPASGEMPVEIIKAVLALIQCEIEGKIAALEWALKP